jgi:hypothetical protein
MATRPQTLYGLADSPIDLAAFLLDHGDGSGQPGLVSYNEHDRGGHFAAWEQPQLLSEDVRETFRSLR